MKKTLEDSWSAVDTAVRRHAYEDAKPWAFVVLVVAFIVGYIAIGYLELPARFESLLAALAAYALGERKGQTFRPKKGGQS